MFAKIRFKTRWHRSLLLLAAVVSPLSLPAAEETVRLFFNFEAQEFSLRASAGLVEAVIIDGGCIERRAAGPASREFSNALRAAEKRFATRDLDAAITREDLIRPNFFFLAHPRFAVAGRANDGTGEMATLLAAARALALALPPADRPGLYVLAFPASAPGKKEPVIAAASLPVSSPLLPALSSAGFPVRVVKPAETEGLPKESVFTAIDSHGRKFLVAYAEGPPFSLAAWLRSP